MSAYEPAKTSNPAQKQLKRKFELEASALY
jgi:hypothetical protein